MKKKKFHEELPYDFEGNMCLEEDALIEDDEKDPDLELPVGFEDILYEAWRESQIHNQNDKERPY